MKTVTGQVSDNAGNFTTVSHSREITLRKIRVS